MTKKKQKIDNSFSTLAEGIATRPMTRVGSLLVNNNQELLFNNRIALTDLYLKHGIVQTVIDVPVNDAIRGGVEILSEQLGENITDLQSYLKKHDVINKIAQTVKWGRLFGGSGLVIKCPQPTNQPFNINKIKENTKLDFYPADLWELNMQYYSQNPMMELPEDTPYMFYGNPLNETRVLKYINKQAPSLKRPMMRGWGMSELEKLIGSLNQFFLNNNILYEIMSEAKIDIYQIQGLRSNLSSTEGTAIVQRQLETMNLLKSYLNAVVMDNDDKFEQKQLTFSGLAEVMKQIRQNLACDVNIPMTKLFGISASGFNSGEDDIENYNAMVEGGVRGKIEYLIIDVLQIVCKKLFNFVPDDLQIKFKSLRILSSEQDEKVKNDKFNRLMIAYDKGIIDDEQLKTAINQDGLLTIGLE
jgi:uncharacterized protein